MSVIQSDVSLRDLHTFHLPVKAERYAEAHSIADLRALLKSAGEMPVYLLGGGSNILPRQDIRGLVIRNCIPGTEIRKTDQGMEAEAGGGVNWDDFVSFTLQSGLGGLENLSLIPGTVGAAPPAEHRCVWSRTQRPISAAQRAAP